MTRIVKIKPTAAGFTAAIVIAILAVVWLLKSNLFNAGEQSTDDAYIRADITQLSPQIAGIVAEVHVDDNQPVKKGQLLARIEPDLYFAQLQQAEAGARSAESQAADARASLNRQNAVIASAAAARDTANAELAFARQQRQRYQQMAAEGAGSQQDFQKASADLLAREAKLAQSTADYQAARSMLPILQARCAGADSMVKAAEAELALAQLHYRWTNIVAPEEGIVTGRWLRPGQYVAPGMPLLSLVPAKNAYIIANFQETQLERVRVGQPVHIRLDSYPHREFDGKVESIAPASGSSLSAGAPTNATGNFTKIVQRIPIKVVFSPESSAALERGELRVGMSSHVTIDTDNKE